MPRLFLANLGHNCRQRDIEKMFRGYGELRNINIKGKYGFLEMDHKEDAEDAIRDLNGKSFNGGRIKIEYSHAYIGSDRRGDRDRRGGGGDRGRELDRDVQGRRVSDGKYRRTNYRLIVENISSRTSWQDLKDHMKKAGEVIYTTVKRPNSREGLVEFADKDAMEYALKELDDTKLDGRRIKLVEEKRSPSRSRSRSNRRGARRSESNRSRSQERIRRQRSSSQTRKSRSRCSTPLGNDINRRSFSTSPRYENDSEKE